MQEKTITSELPKEGFVRVNQFTTNTIIKRDKKTKEVIETIRMVGVLPISISVFLRRVKEGVYPQPSKQFGPRCTVWRVEDIRGIMNNSHIKKEEEK